MFKSKFFNDLLYFIAFVCSIYALYNNDFINLLLLIGFGILITYFTDNNHLIFILAISVAVILEIYSNGYIYKEI